MENQVQRLLQSEKEVNKNVQGALEAKRKKLATIQGEAEIAVQAFKKSLEEEMKQKVAHVRRSCRKDILYHLALSYHMLIHAFTIETSSNRSGERWWHRRCRHEHFGRRIRRQQREGREHADRQRYAS